MVPVASVYFSFVFLYTVSSCLWVHIRVTSDDNMPMAKTIHIPDYDLVRQLCELSGK